MFALRTGQHTKGPVLSGSTLSMRVNAELQRPDTVTILYNILYNHDHEFRQVRMNQPHPAKVVPSAHGDSVGRDTLVIDTVGVKVAPIR
jgi:hypothetical protein